MIIVVKKGISKETAGKDTVLVYFVAKKDVEVVKENGHTALHIGIGEAKDITERKFISLCRKVVLSAKRHKIKRISLDVSDFLFPRLKQISKDELASRMVQNFEMANFEFTKFKTKPKDGWNSVEEIMVCAKGLSQSEFSLVEVGMKKGKLIGEETNKCRALSNTPGGDMTPTILGNEARKACKGTRVKVRVLGRNEMKKLKMGAVLGVAKGSHEEPKFIIMEYRGGKGKEQPVVLVGKGVTFDTGGLNLKPETGISDMHLDMSGGAAVISSVVLAAKLKLKKNVIGLIPAVENMPGGEAYRPGDILRSMSGKTIEVLNTDAEGRVILADALTYAKRYNPRLVVDVATLTGASLIALGQHASAITTPDKKLEILLQKLGEESGEYVWPFPLWDEYEDMVKGNFGDVANIPASGNSRYAGVIGGGMFLYQFAKDLKAPWVHIDMAPRMVSGPSDHLAKGAAGSPVRLLVKLLEEY